MIWTKAVLKQLNQANRRLAELKGVALTIPNENILVSTLTLQEAKDSSEVENIVTTQDDLYQGAAESFSNFVANGSRGFCSGHFVCKPGLGCAGILFRMVLQSLGRGVLQMV